MQGLTEPGEAAQPPPVVAAKQEAPPQPQPKVIINASCRPLMRGTLLILLEASLKLLHALVDRICPDACLTPFRVHGAAVYHGAILLISSRTKTLILSRAGPYAIPGCCSVSGSTLLADV